MKLKIETIYYSYGDLEIEIDMQEKYMNFYFLDYLDLNYSFYRLENFEVVVSKRSLYYRGSN